MKISEYYKQLAEVEDLDDVLEVLCMGHYPLRTVKQYPHWPQLLAHCSAVALDLGEQPFRGGITIAQVMHQGMRRLKVQDGLDIPGPWLAIMRTLRKLPDESVQKTTKP